MYPSNIFCCMVCSYPCVICRRVCNDVELRLRVIVALKINSNVGTITQPIDINIYTLYIIVVDICMLLSHCLPHCLHVQDILCQEDTTLDTMERKRVLNALYSACKEYFESNVTSCPVHMTMLSPDFY